MQRRIATKIVEKLQTAGHAAFLVGGCVRDMLLKTDPKDYDVATSAIPERICALFPHARRIGASFGVVQVDGVEVATFRSDKTYTDGRRPDAVSYETDPRLDASRRDFTINAMFFDPLKNELHDFFGGREDLERGVIRAIGDPRKRFNEDHLRMLRAIRFAARFGYTIEAETEAAIRDLAAKILKISTERVRDELSRILLDRNASRGVTLAAGLLPDLEVEADAPTRFGHLDKPPSFALAWAAYLYPRYRNYKFSAADSRAIRGIIDTQPPFAQAAAMSKSELKRFLRQPYFAEACALQRALCLTAAVPPAGLQFAESRLALYSPAALSPPPLLDGADLIALGLTPGPRFSYLLRGLETAQLEEQITTREEAITLVRSLQACP